MSYDNGFYQAYEAYLQEAGVRRAHDFVFHIARHLHVFAFSNVIDFGCGKSNEFKLYARPENYIGVDVNAESPNIQANYRDIKLNIINEKRVKSFVSLFSSEITAPFEKNREFYEKLFRETSIEEGLVSGFYYADKKDKNPVIETGGVESYQTLESSEEAKSNVYSETRIILPVSSQLFGPNVYEVWKIFRKIPV